MDSSMPVEEESRKYTFIIIPNGQYEFLRCPISMCNNPSVFQRYVNEVFKKLI